MTRSVSNFHPRIVWINIGITCICECQWVALSGRPSEFNQTKSLVVSEGKMRSRHAETCSWTQLWSCTQVPTYVFLRKFLTMHTSRPLFTIIHHKLSYLWGAQSDQLKLQLFWSSSFPRRKQASHTQSLIPGTHFHVIYTLLIGAWAHSAQHGSTILSLVAVRLLAPWGPRETKFVESWQVSCDTPVQFYTRHWCHATRLSTLRKYSHCVLNPFA